MQLVRRPVRRLTLAAFVPALLTVLALPFGFIEVRVAEIAGLYGLYFALPAVVAWCLDAVRNRLPRSVQRTLGVLILLVAILAVAFWLFWTGPLFIFAAPPTAVVLIVGVRLVRARSSDRSNAVRSATPGRAANASW
jgi:hypothetical protein